MGDMADMFEGGDPYWDNPCESDAWDIEDWYDYCPSMGWARPQLVLAKPEDFPMVSA